MADIIHLLPDSVANQIAAGEVIQRPASVIKELVENAVDAGASEIRIVIKDAGKTLIQVADNGCGMSETDVRMAFERHATSKIKNADDLFSLHTMGFRGEALPSICAISEVEVRTRQASSQLGTRLVIMGSRVVAQEPCACDVGTVFSVRKIFYNVPARRKFLKSDSVELSNIMREFERLALVNNNVRMSIDTGSRRLDLRPASLRIRIEDIWKNSLKADHLIPVEVDTSLVKIEGYVSRPEYARRRNPLQFLIVNGRNMQHNYFRKAILSCFDSLIASDTLPCYFMKFTVDPSSIDVNIHPTKNEIKFEYEQQIWPILVSAVKTALGKYSAVPSIDFDTDAIELHPLRTGETPHAPEIKYRGDYNPFSPQSKSTHVDSNWESLYRQFSSSTPSAPLEDNESLFETEPVKKLDPICIQFAAKYIVTSTREGLMLIDQHRAHVKILYEQYLDKVKRTDVISQRVMFPDSISLDQAQQLVLPGVLDQLERLGFSLEYEEDTRWRITAVPAMFRDVDAADVIMRILDSEAVDSANYGKDGDVASDLSQRLALALARGSAIRRGQRLSQDEMEGIVSALFSLPDPSLTPNGNAIYTLVDDQKIAAMLS